jgi:hypothetical protein
MIDKRGLIPRPVEAAEEHMVRTTQFSLRTALSCMSLVAIWLGAFYYARSAEMHVGSAMLLAAAGSALWFRRYLPSWMAWVVVLMIGIAVVWSFPHPR